MYFLYFFIIYYLHLEKGGALYFNKLEFPSTKKALCKDWLKLALRCWRRFFKKIVHEFLLFRYYLPLEKGMVFYLNNRQWTNCDKKKFTWAFSSGVLKTCQYSFLLKFSFTSHELPIWIAAQDNSDRISSMLPEK